MNNRRRNILKVAGLNAVLTLLPVGLLTALSKRLAASTKYVNRVLVHIPADKSVATGNQELKLWANTDLYTATLERFTANGRLLGFTISRNQNPFAIELRFASLESRQMLIHELETLRVFDETKRLSLGYTMTEEISTMGEHGELLSKQPVRTHA